MSELESSREARTAVAVSAMPVKKPRVFIASSREGLGIARQFHETLSLDVDPALWCQPGVFEPTTFTLEGLISALDTYSHALVVLSPDDVTMSRGQEEITPRDNLIFELGMFVGRHGRRSVFLAIPETVRLKIPSDIIGLTPVKYRVVSGRLGPTYDVVAASSQISRSLQNQALTDQSPHEPSAFWDNLSDTIFLVFGIERELDVQPHHRPRISLRDLETAWELKSFLDRRYPAKRVWPIPATPLGWETLMRTDADLVLVGGFVTNEESAKLRSRYEQHLRLKLGRLCVVNGQRVHFPQFSPDQDGRLPLISDPRGVENFPTDLTLRDFGFAYSGTCYAYGRSRRVVAIAGIKGHGTRAAARFLTDGRPGIDAFLHMPLGRDDHLEIAVTGEVFNDRLEQVAPVCVVLNDRVIFDAPATYGTPCELNRPCAGCDYGVPSAVTNIAARGSAQRPLSTRIRAIVFDLDDTLVDTFGTLIVPLELKAAKAMIGAGAPTMDPNRLAALLLRLRRVAPDSVERELRTRSKDFSAKVLAARRTVFAKASITNLSISPEVIELLHRLASSFELYLLTAGPVAFQTRKIEALELRPLFSDVLVIGEATRQAKAEAIEKLAIRRQLQPESMLVVGNRLDNEIAAANGLGMTTIWVRRGEGSGVSPHFGTGQPDITVNDVLEVAQVLKR